jgi:hypothetical protein
MRILRYLAMVPLGIVASYGVAQSTNGCASEVVPCEGSQTVNGYGCSDGCPPFSGGCCEYTTYRVNCNEGPDQFYTVRNCWEVKHCDYIVIEKVFQCTVL